MWGETKLAKMAWSGSLTPQPLGLALRFVNNVYIRAEIACSTAHAHHKALTWSQAALCSRPVRTSPRKPWLLRHMGYIGVASWLTTGKTIALTRWTFVMVMLWLLLQLLLPAS